MSEWHAELRRRLAPLQLPPTRELEIVDEMAQHLDAREAELRQAGLAAADARRGVLDEIADDTKLRRELARLGLPAGPPLPPPGARAGSRLDRWRQDLRYAVRGLWQRPGFTLPAVLALAIGIGANAAIFAAVDTVLLRPMPFPHADRLFVPVSIHHGRDIEQGNVTFADYTDWRAQTDLFAGVAVWRPISVDVTGDGDPERVQIAQVSEDFFRLIDVTPLRGRALAAADSATGSAGVAVLSYGLWQRRFGGLDSVVGSTIRVAGQPLEVVGVLPPRIVWPDDAALFVPMRPSTFSEDVRTRRDNMIFQGLARLQDGVPAAMADARLAAMAARLELANPVIRKGWSNALVPLREYIVDGNLRVALLVLLGAVAAVLMIACANVANLALVRGSGRAREMAVRLSLGASRGRLIELLIVEGLVLTAIGAAGGLALSAVLMKGLAAIAPEGTPFVDTMALNGRVLAATIVVSAVAAVVSSLVPALSNSSVRLSSSLREGSAGSGSSRRANRLRSVLIVSEVATTVVLLTGAALLLRSFDRLTHVDAGVSLDRVVTGRISIPTARYPDAAKRAQFVQQLVAKLESFADVESAAATSYVPAGGGGFGLGRVFLREGQPEPPATADTSAQWNVVTPDYFRTLGIPLLSGRVFDARDTAASTPVIIVTRGFARQAFGGQSPIGRRIRSWRDENVLREIVGVVEDVRYEGLADRDTRLIYVPHTQDSWGGMQLAVRAKGANLDAVAPELRRAVAALDPQLAVAGVRSLRESADRSIASQRYATMLLSLLAGVALLLSALGLFGVTSYVFTLRRREMGIRLALGASRGRLYALVFRHGLTLTLAGVAIGVAGAIAASRILQALLFDTAAGDPVAWAGMLGAIIVSSALACLVPARRAAGADPTGALRAE